MRYIKVATAPTEAQDVINDNETSLVKTWSSNKIQKKILEGGEYTGPIDLPTDQYVGDNKYGMNCHNSDITGLNAMYFGDTLEEGEGLMFPKSSGSGYDNLRVKDGRLLFKAGDRTTLIGGWEDITSSVTLTKVSGNSTVTKVGCYLTSGFVKINFNIRMTATTTAGNNISVFKFSSPRFTSSSILSRVFSATYYSSAIVTYGCNVYGGETNTITVRNSSTSNTNDEYQCCLVIPVETN